MLKRKIWLSKIEIDVSKIDVKPNPRVRPLTPHENNRKNSQALNYPGEGQVLVNDPNSGQTKLFTFTVVFEPEATQEDVFEHCGIKRLIDMALDGFASTIMAYGQTGAGKTYTLTGPPDNDEGGGDNQQEPGIMQLAFGYLFAEIQLRKGVEYVVQASYLEVYKEHVLDLLNPSPKTLPVRWSKDKGFYAENLFVVECEDLGDLDGVLQEGRKNRQVRSHEMNEHSSRSHTILSISLASEIQDPDDPNTYIRRQGKLSLVDLAGSEKTKKTKSKGNTLTEANNINKSLLVLGNCISCLADPKKRSGHIPYRDSTLTKLLADSLGGNGMALIDNDEGGGDNQQEPGIMQLAFGYLFAEIQLRKGVEYVVQASYLEVYKEHVLDLLNPSPKTLPVRWSKDKGFYAENLFVVECEDLGDLDGVLQEGRKNRQVRSHEMNEHSSRSHTILSISLASEIQDPDDPNTYIRRQGKLSLVDLAGSEKTKKTKSKGNTLTEANNINKSLLVLGNCISCLVACVSPSASNAPETINTLRYASRAKRVKTKPMVRMDPRELLILSLRREVRLLRMENSYLRQQMMTNGRLQLNGIVPVGGVSPDGDSGIDLMREGHPPGEEGDPRNERALLHKYMTENESLRVENATMHHMREMLVRDHELVCRENERLLKRLGALERWDFAVERHLF
ncbi:kinesin-like protein KIF12 [Ixodes scapularis]